MTDLPQLQTLLVDAASRRRRRRRARRVTARVAVAAALIAAVPLLAREVAAPDPEVTAPTPTATATPATVEQAWSEFRRPATNRDTPPAYAQGDDARRIGGPQAHPAYLLKRGEDLCLAVRNARPPMSCGPASLYAAGHAILTHYRAATLFLTVPEAVKSVTLTVPGHKPFVWPNTGVLAAVTGGESVRLQWRAPDGTPRTEQLNRRDPATFWSRFWDVETPSDHRDQLPGARRLIAEGDVMAWLVPRRDAMCLQVYAGNAGRSACRQNLSDTRFPIVVSVGDATVAAFPDTLEPLAVEPAGVRHTLQRDAILIRGDATTIRYRDRAGERELRIPEQKDFVLHAERMNPLNIMPYGK